jgi:uncharacterized membrane protein (UPF0127 family)
LSIDTALRLDPALARTHGCARLLREVFMPLFASSFRMVAASLSLVAALALASTIVPGRAHAQGAPATAEAALEPLEIQTASGTHRFSVEVMRDDAQRARGLMFRRYLPADRGMLFDFKREEPISMWMKNTFISLDMIFADRTGRIVSIAQDTEPLSERIIPSGEPAYAVLEVNAGTARRLGIKPGDRLRHPMFR